MSQALTVETFVAQVGPQLVRALTVHVGDRETAEDLAQETLVRCIERWSRVAGADRPDAYAFRVAFNLANSRWRRLRRRQELTGRPAPWPASGEPAGDRAEARDDVEPEDVLTVRSELAALPGRQRAAVVCRHLLGFDVRTTATVLGCAEGTVKSLTSQGLEKLRRRLAEPQFLEGVEP